MKQNNAALDIKQAPPQSQSQTNVLESTLENLSGLTTFEQHGEDFDEISFANRMDYEEQQRQKKKRRGFKL